VNGKDPKTLTKKILSFRVQCVHLNKWIDLIASLFHEKKRRIKNGQKLAGTRHGRPRGIESI
jgi:hypothetical protein